MGFNTQPPKGGCAAVSAACAVPARFNTQPPKGGCGGQNPLLAMLPGFNTQPPKGGCQYHYHDVWFRKNAARFQHTAA